MNGRFDGIAYLCINPNIMKNDLTKNYNEKRFNKEL